MCATKGAVNGFINYLYPTLYEALEPYAFQAQGMFDLVGIREYIEERFPKEREEIPAFASDLTTLLNEAVYHSFLRKKPEKSYYLLPNFKAFEMEFIAMATALFEDGPKKLAQTA